MKDSNLPVITIEEARADAPASFIDKVHPKSKEKPGKNWHICGWRNYWRCGNGGNS